MKKLILFITSIMMFGMVTARELPTEELYVGQFNAVKVNVPATIKCKISEEYSVKLKSDEIYKYKLSLVEDTLIISPVFKSNEEIYKMESDKIVVILRHPEPEKIVNNVLYDKKVLKAVKTKSGNPRK